MSIELVMPCNHLVLCHPLLLLPPTRPSIRVFSNESTLHMRWPKYWSFSFSICPSMTVCMYMIYMPVISLLIFACMHMLSQMDLFVHGCANYLRHITVLICVYVHEHRSMHVHAHTCINALL